MERLLDPTADPTGLESSEGAKEHLLRLRNVFPAAEERIAKSTIDWIDLKNLPQKQQVVARRVFGKCIQIISAIEELGKMEEGAEIFRQDLNARRKEHTCRDNDGDEGLARLRRMAQASREFGEEVCEHTVAALLGFSDFVIAVLPE
jgi:hypothetical protein